MKPTKEQLADPKWWDEQVFSQYKFCYWSEEGRYVHFTVSLIPEEELLAKRPEPDWKPEVGEWYEVESDIRNVWKKAMYIGVDSVGSHVFDVEKRHLWRIDSIGTLVRPIKTQREELIDLVATALQTDDQDVTELCNKSESMFMSGATKSVDAILARFDLTEKDGN